MKASAVISVLLVLVCATARTAPAQPRANDARTVVSRVADDLATYWRATLGARVASYRGPRDIVFYRSRIDTACGLTSMLNARYCPGDETIYLDETWIDGLLAVDDFTAIAILAHEWGHEVQDELGALDRSKERRYVRALELQADCFAGLFTRSQQDVGAVGGRALTDARRFFASAGDPSSKTLSHGTGAQRVAWFNAGYGSGDLAVCESVFKRERALPRIPSQ
jgi:hypothetical protein